MAEPTSEANPKTPETPEKSEGPAVLTPELEKLLEKTAQSAADKVRTEYSQKMKKVQEELDALQMEKLSAKERAEREQQKLKAELEEKARTLNRKSLELLATQELEKNGLDIGFLETVIGSDEDATRGRIAHLKQTFDAAKGKAVESALKAAGRDPMKGREGSAQTSGIEGMTPAEISAKAKKDPAWWNQNEAAILAKIGSGGFKK